MLPKFLIADNSQELPETIFVVHTESPRFIVESEIEDFQSNQKIHWIDQEPKDAKEIEALVGSAEDFLNSELEYQEELFDEENNE